MFVPKTLVVRQNFTPKQKSTPTSQPDKTTEGFDSQGRGREVTTVQMGNFTFLTDTEFVFVKGFTYLKSGESY